MPYVIKVLEGSAEALRDVFKKREYFFHFRSIPDVAVLTKRHTPSSCFRAQRCFQAFCEGKIKQTIE